MQEWWPPGVRPVLGDAGACRAKAPPAEATPAMKLSSVKPSRSADHSHVEHSQPQAAAGAGRGSTTMAPGTLNMNQRPDKMWRKAPVQSKAPEPIRMGKGPTPAWGSSSSSEEEIEIEPWQERRSHRSPQAQPLEAVREDAPLVSPLEAGYARAPLQPQIYIHPTEGYLVNENNERCDKYGRLTRKRGSTGSGRSWGKGKGARRDGPPQAASSSWGNWAMGGKSGKGNNPKP